jgi:hypothetical protein
MELMMLSDIEVEIGIELKMIKVFPLDFEIELSSFDRFEY